MSDEIKSRVRKQFGENAHKYVTSAGHAKGQDLAWLVEVSGAEPAMNALDVATGGGHVANALAPLVSRVTALDMTEVMLQAAGQFIRGNGHSNVDFVAGDAEKLPFPNESFDLVTCRIAAHHFPHVRDFVAEAYRVTRTGGRLLLIDNVVPESEEADRFYNEIECRRDPSHVRAWRKTEWISMLESAGFRVEAMEIFRKTFKFAEWCERMALPRAEQSKLEETMLAAPEHLRQTFRFQRGEDGTLFRFEGESMGIRAVKEQLNSPNAE